MEQLVWRRKPRDKSGEVILEPEPPIQFNGEMLALKKIMDDKLKCQNCNEHKVENGKWMTNVGGSQPNSKYERYCPDEWLECKTCNL